MVIASFLLLRGGRGHTGSNVQFTRCFQTLRMGFLLIRRIRHVQGKPALSEIGKRQTGFAISFMAFH